MWSTSEGLKLIQFQNSLIEIRVLCDREMRVRSFVRSFVGVSLTRKEILYLYRLQLSPIYRLIAEKLTDFCFLRVTEAYLPRFLRIRTHNLAHLNIARCCCPTTTTNQWSIVYMLSTYDCTHYDPKNLPNRPWLGM